MNENVWQIVTCSPTGSFATYCTIEMVARAFWTSFPGLELHMLSKMSHHVNQPTPMRGLVSCDVPFVWDTGHCVATVCTGWFSWLLCWCTRVLPGWTQVSQNRSNCDSPSKPGSCHPHPSTDSHGKLLSARFMSAHPQFGSARLPWPNVLHFIKLPLMIWLSLIFERWLEN